MMKKTLALTLVLVLCLSICGCGNTNKNTSANNENTPAGTENPALEEDIQIENEDPSAGEQEEAEEPEVTEEPEVIEDKLSLDELVGTWTKSLWCYPTPLVINQNSTYDYGDGKGTFSFSETNFTVGFSSRSGDDPGQLKYLNGYLYCTSHWLSKDNDYGLPFSPDENGRTEQEFSTSLSVIYQYDPAVGFGSFTLILHSDGTFVVKTSELLTGITTTYEGTYSYQDSILTLTYEGTDHPLVVVNDVIYFLTYHK